MTTTFDAIVVGSGMSGGWAAKELCEAGLKTLVLERGRNVEHVKDYPTAMLDPWQLPNGNRATQQDLVDYPVQSTLYLFGQDMKHFLVKDVDHPYNAVKDFRWYRGYQVGGRSLLWARHCFRWSDLDFGANAREGVGIDWPIRYKDIEPWYDHVEEFIGVSGENAGLPQLPDGKLQPPFEMNCIELHFREQLKTKFTDRQPDQQPAGRAQPAAQGTRRLPGAESLPPRLPVRRVLLEQLLHDPGGRGHRQHDAASALDRAQHHHRPEHGPRDGHPHHRRRDAREDRVLREGDLPERVGAEHDGADAELEEPAPSERLRELERRDGPLPDGPPGVGRRHRRPQRLPGQVLQGTPQHERLHPALPERGGETPDFTRGFAYEVYTGRAGWSELAGQPGMGAEFKDSLTKPGPWTIYMEAFGECLPRHENTVSLNYDKPDKWGMPTLDIDMAYGPNEAAMRKDMQASAVEMLKAAGFDNVEGFDRGPHPGEVIHEMGTARMGADPKQSVVNAHNQCHDASNVFITDGACMASTACQNPSLTYMALTARACAFAVEHLKRGDL